MEQEANTIFFSIITVCLNVEKTIRLTMESVLNQTWSNFEYIIVDGGSKDGTLDIIQEFAKVDRRIKWRSEQDKGIFNAMNKGITRSRGNFLLFLNAGDEFHSARVLEEAAEMAANADIVIGDLMYKTEMGISKIVYPVGVKLLKDLKEGKNVCHQVIFASKDCLSEGFDENFMFCADYDWLCHQVKAGKKIEKLNDVVVNFDTQGVTFQVKHQKRHWEEYFEVIEKHFPCLEFEYGDKIKALFVQQKKDHFLYEFINRWLMLKQRGIEISTFFLERGMRTVAIYGIRHMGERLYDELKESEVNVEYVIDRNPIELDGKVLVRHPDEELKPVDAVVITPIFDFLEIKDKLSDKLDCPMFFIEDVLFYEYEDAEHKTI